MASFWASLNAGRVDRQGSVADDEVDHHEVESDAHAENPPELTDVDSESGNDCDEEPPDLIEADSDNDVDQDTVRQRKRKNVADEFAVEENTIRPRRAYTFTKRQRKASKPRRAVSTQRGKAEKEALLALPALRKCGKGCCESIPGADLEAVVVRSHHEYRSRTTSERGEWLSTILQNVSIGNQITVSIN